MSLVVDDPDFQLWQGDALEMLRGLPSGSVHCALTSPPFYGLRDYGTGSWEGGDEGCDHVNEKAPGQRNDSASLADYDKRVGHAVGTVDERSARREAGLGTSLYRDVCGKCGARRVDNQIGLEATPDEWVARLVDVFREVRRVLRDDGTLWVEIGDSYCANQGAGFNSVAFRGEGHVNRKRLGQETPMRHPFKPKDLVGAPWLLAFALRADGWYLRSEIIWDRPNPMPESVTDRPTKSHSTVFLLAKSPRYFFDAEAVREPHAEPTGSGGWQSQARRGERRNTPRTKLDTFERNGGTGSGIDHMEYNPAGRNVRSVWRIATQPTPFAHFATWPEKLVERIILAGTSERGCCPECGAPWKREVDVTYGEDKASDWAQRAANGANTGGVGKNFRDVNRQVGDWIPSCDCGTDQGVIGQVGTVAHDPVPCTVLDPFMGSGTTALVARRLGRRSVGVELSPEYAELCARRLQQQSLFALTEPARPPAATPFGLDLSRAQARRALEIARTHGLTVEHIAALRACGISDVGKALVTTHGTGKNTPEVQALADEARAALRGYSREFLIRKFPEADDPWARDRVDQTDLFAEDAR